MLSIIRFLIGFIISFVFLTWLTFLWIPYDYPTLPKWVLWYMKAKDQLFRVNSYGYIIIPVSLIIGYFLGYRKRNKTLLE